MTASQSFSEDEAVRDRLTDPVDIEAFANLVACARQKGKSAVALIQEEPNLTSRPQIRKLCVGQHKARFIWTQLRSLLNRMGKPTRPPRLG